DRLAGGLQECVHREYFLPPVRAPIIEPAPNSADAKRLIETFTLKLARSYTSCHDFEFAFLGRAQSAESLPEYLREIHHQLCSK
ncbi:MAG: hypothetical protein HC883_04315, partial [Bdellovibrionaceae bacterium]|nr:hypothetical protein [Pseudobdellovibrionaceae bacterium]